MQTEQQNKTQEHPVRAEAGFDLRTHISDPKSGTVLKVQPYTLHVKSGVRYFERPVRSGNVFFEDGSPAGRISKGEVDEHASHILVKEAQAPEEMISEMQEENAQLKAELAAMKAEQDKKAQAPAAKAPGAQAPVQQAKV